MSARFRPDFNPVFFVNSMTASFKKTLFIFRRDLRLEDNRGLAFALRSSLSVIPIFIFTPEQIDKNPYKSERCLNFMLESLQELDDSLRELGGRLFYFKGPIEEVLNRCVRELQIDAIAVNRDYTPYSIARDSQIEKICKHHSVSFHSCDDALLLPPEETLKKEGKPYTVFTAFYRSALHKRVEPPLSLPPGRFYQEAIAFAAPSSLLFELKADLKTPNAMKGGRKAALSILDVIRQGERFKEYATLRDFPCIDHSSTHLSSYLKFTLCSPREVLAALLDHPERNEELIRSLYWRDFFSSISFFFPHVFKGSFYPKFDHLQWCFDTKKFERWCQGETGFPIVDAGMREMNETGLMHNRVRMIVASFLIKDLCIDWRWGERYFAQKLLDYDPAVNNGNWQWVAGTGSSAQPYFRIFNPWSQQKKYDPECLYIKRWIPELRRLPASTIHEWHTGSIFSSGTSYPTPMLDHEEASKKALELYKQSAP